MLKVSNIEMPNYIRIPTINLLSVKDFATFLENTSEEYYSVPIKYLTKVYKSIGMKDYQFVKTFYEVKKEWMVALTRENLVTKLKYYIYKLEDQKELIFLSPGVFMKLKQMINYFSNFDIQYQFENNSHSKLVFLLLNNKSGVYILVNLIEEKIKLYYAEIQDDMLFLNENGELDFNDDNFLIEFQQFIEGSANIVTISYFYEEVDKYKLTWSEIMKIYRNLRLKLSDENITQMCELNDIKKLIEFSPYTVKDIFKLYYSNLELPQLGQINYLYDDVQKENIQWFKLKSVI